MSIYIRPGIYTQEYEDLVDDKIKLSSISISTSGSSYKSAVDQLYIDMMTEKMNYKNELEISKSTMQKLIVEALGLPERLEQEIDEMFKDEDFEL